MKKKFFPLYSDNQTKRLKSFMLVVRKLDSLKHTDDIREFIDTMAKAASLAFSVKYEAVIKPEQLVEYLNQEGFEDLSPLISQTTDIIQKIALQYRLIKKTDYERSLKNI